MERFLLSGNIIEYTNRIEFLSDIPTDFLVTFSDQVGLNFRDSAQPIKDTNGGYPFTMKGSVAYQFNLEESGLPVIAGEVNPYLPELGFGSGPFAYSLTGDKTLEFKFASKINAFGANLGGYNVGLDTVFELDVMCPDGVFTLIPDITTAFDQFYGFALDGDAAYEVNVNTYSPTINDGIFWDSIVGRFMTQECIGCGDPHVSYISSAYNLVHPSHLKRLVLT